MRLRVQNRIRKILRARSAPAVAPSQLPAIVRDREADPDLRGLAAEMLALDKRQRDPYGPLFAHLIESRGYLSIELMRAIARMRHPARPTAEMEAFARALRSSPDEAHRIAIADLLRAIPGATSRRLLIETMERGGESIGVRSSAAESLQDFPHQETLHAYARCLANTDPEVRFWAAFGLGSMSSHRPAYHPYATAVLAPLSNDSGSAPEFWWPVGHEARAMLAKWDCGVWAGVQRECAAIKADPQADERFLRWAESYGGMVCPRWRWFV